jgi:hypothetical protein
MPSCFSGNRDRNAPKSSASNFFVGANCQRIGPRWDPSSVSPCVRNFVIDSPASARTLRLVTKRLAFSEKMKSSGTSEAHLAKVSGFWLL